MTDPSTGSGQATHAHPTIRYTVHMQPTHFWQRLLGIAPRLVVIGIASGVKDGELLIKCEHERFYSINFACVLWMQADIVKGSG